MQNAETKAGSSTAKPVFNSSFFIRHSAFVLIALFTLAVRLPRLGERPMHTDESVNAYLVGQVLAGEVFRYDPQDRHGPALAAETLPIVRLFGVKKFADLTESQLRLVPVLTGVATVLLLGAAVEMFGFIPCLIAALLFAIAPLPVYYNRYFIHETLFVTATLGWILSGWRAWRNNTVLPAMLAGFCAALMLACKETAVLHFFAFLLAGLGCWMHARKSSTAALPSLKIILTALTVFLCVAFLVFSWFGRNLQVVGDLPRAVSSLMARSGGQGHEKPFWYYLVLLAGGWSGGIFLALSGFGLFRIFRNSSLHLKSFLFLAIYTLAIVVIYSAIPYKTPWLALNFWLPLALFAGLGAEWIWQKGGKGHLGFWVPAVGLGILLGGDTWNRAFTHAADEKNPYAYAQTSEDLLRLPARLETLAKQHRLSDPKIAVVAADAWPLPWYLRKFPRVGFWQPGQETGAADFFITTTDLTGNLADQLKAYRPEYFGVRPEVLLILWSPPEINPAP